MDEDYLYGFLNCGLFVLYENFRKEVLECLGHNYQCILELQSESSHFFNPNNVWERLNDTRGDLVGLLSRMEKKEIELLGKTKSDLHEELQKAAKET
jgi:hypothetical protein